MNGGNFNLNMVALADTGQWRMIVTVSFSGISAILKNVIYPEVEPVPLFKKDWDADETNILDYVEAAVYDNPRLLDDFSTQILIYTSKVLWIPSELTEDEEYDENLFTSVYPVETEDIFSDFGDKEVALYTLAPGLNSFFRRTLPGCKISSHLTLLKREFGKIEKEESLNSSKEEPHDSIYINCRDSQFDILAFRNGKFLSGSVHIWKSVDDIIYRALLLCRVYKLAPSLTVNVVGADVDSNGLVRKTQRFFLNMRKIQMPSLSEMYNLPLAAALAAGSNISLQ